MTAFDTFISLAIVIAFLFIIYLKITQKTFQEAIGDFKSIFAKEPAEEITQW